MPQGPSKRGQNRVVENVPITVIIFVLKRGEIKGPAQCKKGLGRQPEHPRPLVTSANAGVPPGPGAHTAQFWSGPIPRNRRFSSAAGQPEGGAAVVGEAGMETWYFLHFC